MAATVAWEAEGKELNYRHTQGRLLHTQWQRH